jgi:membrane protease YdiL (CAAX protease family)
LYDPWSEPLPPAPTLFHAMVAIAALVDVGATLTGLALGFGGSQFATIARPMLYGVAGIFVATFVANFLAGRGVTLQQVIGWPHPGQAGRIRAVAVGVIGGAGLGALALCYLQALQLLPDIAEPMQRTQQLIAQNPGLRLSYASLAVLIAPFVEEFLFRGLLFRALDREWGGWRAVLGSAAFFAIYHPPVSWLPVSLVGIVNALLFKWTGRLEAAMAVHLTYNAVLTTL